MLDDVDEWRSDLKRNKGELLEGVRARNLGPSDPGGFLKLVETRGDDLPVSNAIEIARHREFGYAIGNDGQGILSMPTLER
jgi:hypothetical protein